MSSKLTRAAYEQLIAENLAWLDQMPPSLERDHIREIVKASAGHEYPDTSDLDTLRAAVRQHRDEKGHDRCWIDDLKLYAHLPEGAGSADLSLPPKDEFLRGCERYYELRRTNDHDTADDEARRLAKNGVLGVSSLVGINAHARRLRCWSAGRATGKLVLAYEPGAGELIDTSIKLCIGLAVAFECTVVCLHNDRIVRARPDSTEESLWEQWERR